MSNDKQRYLWQTYLLLGALIAALYAGGTAYFLELDWLKTLLIWAVPIALLAWLVWRYSRFRIMVVHVKDKWRETKTFRDRHGEEYEVRLYYLRTDHGIAMVSRDFFSRVKEDETYSMIAQPVDDALDVFCWRRPHQVSETDSPNQ